MEFDKRNKPPSETDIAAAIAATPDGDKIADYFGLSGQIPEQDPNEAARSQTLIEGLQALTKGQPAIDPKNLFEAISSHCESSPLDADLLRALRKKS